MLSATIPLFVFGFAAMSINKPISREAGAEPQVLPAIHYRPTDLPSSGVSGTQISATVVPITKIGTSGKSIALTASYSIHPTEQKLKLLAQQAQGAERRAAQEALTFFNALPGGVPMPHPLQTDRGVTMLVWNRGDIYAEVEFEGNGRCYVYCRDLRQAQGEGVEDLPVAPMLHLEAERVLALLAPHILGRHFALAA